MANKRTSKKQSQKETNTKVKDATKTLVAKDAKPAVKVDKQPEKKVAEKTTVYSMSAIIYTIVASIVVVLSMIVWIKPGYYYMESLFGKTVDFYSLDIAYEMNFQRMMPKSIGALFIVIGICALIGTILAIVMVARTMKAANKPMPIVSILCLMITIVALVLFIVASGKLKDTYEYSGMDQIYEVQKNFNLYYGMMVGVIVNVVAAFAHMVMTFVSTSIWKKTGKVR